MRLSVVQMNPGADKAANLAQMRALVEACAAADRPDLVALPEVWTSLGGDRATRLANAEALPPEGSGAAGGEAYEALRALARGLGVAIHGGSLIERPDPGAERLCNTSLVFGPDGAELARYRKVHLFDITAPDGTGYREGALYDGGDQLATCAVAGVRLGLSVCYDLRFPELYLALREAGAELLLVPSAFTLQTGKDHWEVLLRARAVETQCWVAAPATWGGHQERSGPRQSYGHALVCDPWGHVVARASDGIGWATARLDPGLTARVRRDMPVLEHRRSRRWRPTVAAGHGADPS